MVNCAGILEKGRMEKVLVNNYNYNMNINIHVLLKILDHDTCFIIHEADINGGKILICVEGP